MIVNGGPATSRPTLPLISYVLDPGAPDADVKAPVIRCSNHKDFDLLTRYKRLGEKWTLVGVIQTRKKKQP